MKLINNFRILPQGVKASIAFFIAKFITKGIAYITTPIFTRLLSAEEYGQVSVFFTWVEVLGIVAMFCLSYGVFNNGMVDYPDRRNEYSYSMLIMSNIITIVFGIVFIISYRLIKTYIGIDEKLIILMFLVFLLQPSYNFWTAKQRYEYKYKSTVLWSIIMTTISPLIAILTIKHSNYNRAYARIIGGEVPLLIIYIGFYAYIAKQSKFKVDFSFWKQAFTFNIVLIPHYLSSYLLSSSDKIMISRIVNDAATAYYSVAYSIASIALILWSSINASLIPYTYEKCKKKDYRAISNITIPLLFIFAVGCMAVILIAPEAVKLIAPNSYNDAMYVIPPITGGVFFQVQYYIYANIVYYYKKPKYVMIASIIATVTNLILNYVFISMYGYMAAGYTTLFCYLIQALIDFFAMKSIVNQNIYDMKIIVLLSVAVIVISIFSPLMYNLSFLYRIAVLLTLFIGIWVSRNRLINLITEMKEYK